MNEVLESSAFGPFQSIRHGFFGRRGGVSVGHYESLNIGGGTTDTLAAVEENRRRVATHFGLEASRLLLLRQVHGDRVVTVEAPWEASDRPEADAFVTRQKDLLLVILTADCAPVLFADEKAGVIGAAHAGWRGAVGGVLAATLEAMEALGARRERVAAAVGPCIWQDSYEVGADFPVPFIAENQDNDAFFRASARQGHFLFDLPGYVATKLDRLGVRTIAPSPADTCAAPDKFFSYRYACLHGLADTGRAASAIVLR